MKSLPRHWIPLSKGQSKKLGFALSNRTIKGIAVNGICVFPLCRAVKNLFMSEYSKLQIGCMTGGKTDETIFWKYGNNSYDTHDFIAGRVCRIFNQ